MVPQLWLQYAVRLSNRSVIVNHVVATAPPPPFFFSSSILFAYVEKITVCMWHVLFLVYKCYLNNYDCSKAR
jgi:hypothetical protein